ncbi:MAG: VTT domain-containing protein, partial [Bacillota bacterium]|nr:VTT domain-containing protein [Bacillota bacterium]
MAFLNEYIESYRVFLAENAWIAPIAAFVLPIIEAILPSLPLTALVSANLVVLTAAYGAVWGTAMTIVLSILGSFLGMFGIFLLLRRTVGPKVAKKIEASNFGRKFRETAATGNTVPILALMANPLLPSSIMNYVLSFTKISVKRYVFLTGISRVLIILMIVFLGSLFNLQ